MAYRSFNWNELMTHDLSRTRTFYEDVLGWTFQAMPMPDMTYWIVKNGDKDVGGVYEMVGPDFENMPEQWLPYVAVEDVDARFETAMAAGGAAMREPFDVQGVGRLCILRDAGGAMFGMITPKM